MTTYHKWKVRTMFVALLSVVLLAGCGDDSSEKVDNASKNDKPAVEKKEDLPSKEDLEKEYGKGNVKHPLSEIAGFTEEVEIIEVIDGDTVVVEGENGKETVQLALVQTPEKTLPDGTEDEYYGFRANEYTHNQLQDLDARLERVKGHKGEDGATLGYLWLENSPSHYLFNKQIVEKGIAKVVENDPDSKYLDELRQAEEKAKAWAAEAPENKNIWSKEGYVTKDGFNQSLFK